jgi:hypothetical protein
MSAPTRDDLIRIVDEINKELNPDPAIKVVSRTTSSMIISEIKEVVEAFEGKATVSQKTLDFLTDQEMDVPADIRAKTKASASAKKSTGEKKAPKKEAGEKKPGVITTIEAIIRASSKYKPVSRDKILSQLRKNFPDKEETSMMNTIKVQLPGRMAKEKGMNIKVNDKGEFYL